MPWGVGDVDKFRKGLSEEQKKKWVVIANGVLKSCQDDGGENCEATAIRVANSKVGGKMRNLLIKAAGDWEVEVRAIPFGDINNVDSDGEFFTERTKLYLEKLNPMPVYYHGYSPDGEPMGEPEVIGDTIKKELRPDGVWLRILLDKTSDYAKRVWEAARQGLAAASSGSIPHLVRRLDNGEITHWPFAEISLFDTGELRQPANRYAIALPVLKMMYNNVELESPEGEAKGEQQSAKANSDKKSDKSNLMEDKMGDKPELSLEEIKKVVSETVVQTVKAEFDSKEKEQEAIKARNQEITDAKKAAYEEGRNKAEEELKSKFRLDNIAPEVLQYSTKYDNMDAGEHALLISVLGAAKANIPEASLQSLAAKLEADKTDVGNQAQKAMKSRGIKANEVNYSTYATFGDEWVGTAYSTALWEKIRMGTFVVEKLAPHSIEFPQGMEAMVIPLESTDPVFYKVAQATAIESTLKIPQATVTNSPIQTGNQTLTLAKLGGRTLFTGEMEEDSLIPWVPQVMNQLMLSGRDYLESAIIDGDTETTASTNINNIAGTPAAADWFMVFNGFRKLGLVTNTANSRSAGAGLTVEDFLETVKLLGANGRNALDKSKVSLIVDPAVAWKSLTLPEVSSRDVFSAATIESGSLTGLWGYKIDVSGNMCKASAVQKSNAAGKIDVGTVNNNLYGSILAVRWDQWRMGWRRHMKIETTRIANADSTEIVAMMRMGLTYRDVEAASITYYVGV